MPAEFVHLHLHTEYSLLDGFCRLKPLISRATELGFPAMAVTEHGVMYSAVNFYEMAIAANLKPIIGCEIYLATRSRHDRQPRLDDSQRHLILLAKDDEGYKNLINIVSTASLEGYYYKPRADKDLLRNCSKGLVALSGCIRGEVPFLVRKGDDEGALRAATEYRDIFGPENFFIEVADHGLPAEQRVIPELVNIARKLDLGVVATNDVHYLHPPDHEPHDILLAIQTGRTINDANRMRFGSDQFYLKSAEEMEAVFGSSLPDALKNTLHIADMCTFKMDLSTSHLPDFPCPPGYDVETYLAHLCEEGLKMRFGTDTPAPEIRERLTYELGVIKQMGFPAYFLLIWDFINWSRENDIPVGPGRGSAAGSLVAYLLRVTELNPLEHQLLFERFLNPGRKSMPDVDTDFCQDRRQEVIDYVTRKWGRDRVSQIITFGRLKAKASLRDVGRALAMPLPQVDRIAKMVPAGPNVTLNQALELPELKTVYDTDPAAHRLIDIARKLEGVARNASIHAAGVIISQKPVVEICPVQKMQGGDEVVAQFEMTAVEHIGLLKMDFLGLRNLTVIKDAVGNIRTIHGTAPDMDKIPFDDEATFHLLQEARTSGVFQVESAGMKRYLRALKPERFADIVAMVALYRPGPIQGGVVDGYINCKHGREEISYPHPLTEPILKETYGFMIYQEQVMQISNVLAGFTMAMADDLRKAMGKKNPAVMAKQRDLFVTGCTERNIKAKLAGEIFDLMEKFAGYGFNKSHSAAYAVVTYHTAWLKANYPVEYLCALLTSVSGNSEKVSFVIKEARSMGIEVLPPDINKSRWKFTVEKLPADKLTPEGSRPAPQDGSLAPGQSGREPSPPSGEGGPSGGTARFPQEGGQGAPPLHTWGIRFGLGAIKNVGEAVVDCILVERDRNGPYRTLAELCRRMDAKQMNKRVFESLVLGAAFDCFGVKRSSLWMGLDATMEYGQMMQKDSSAGQASLFDLDDEAAEPSLPALAEFDKTEMLAAEKELLGIHMSSSPLADFATLLSKPPFIPIQKLPDYPANTKVKIGGMISSVRRILTKKNLPMAFLEVEDLTGSIEVTLLPKVFETHGAKAALNAVVSISGKLELRQSGGKSDKAEEEDEDVAAAEEFKILGEDVAPLANLNRFWALANPQAEVEQKLPKPPSLAQLRGTKAEAEPVVATSAPKPFYLQVGDMSDWSSRSDDRQDGVVGLGEGTRPAVSAATREQPPAAEPESAPLELPPSVSEPTRLGWEHPAQPGIHVRVAMTQRHALPSLKDLLARSRGPETVFLHLESPEGKTTLSLGPDFAVDPSQEFIQNAEKLLGRGTIHIQAAKGGL